MLKPPETRTMPSFRALIGTAIVAAALGTIVALMVARGATTEWDRQMLFVVRGSGAGQAPFGPVWFQEAIRDVTALGSMIVLSFVVLGATAYFAASRRYRLAGLVLGSSLAATAYSTALKMMFDRARPDIVEHGMSTFTASFPSGHALLSAAILLTCGGLLAFAARLPNERRVIAAAAVLLTLAVGLSRIYLGVHWPSDVLAGWLFGTVWASLTLALARTLYPASDIAV